MHRRATPIAVLAGALLLLAPQLVRGAGLELREQGAAAIGRSDAVTARLDHPSVVFFNPAGMAFLDGLQVSAGVTLALPSFGYEDPDGNLPGADAKDTVAVPHLYASWRFNEMFAAGISVNIPFGLAVEWPDDFVGANLNQRSEMQMLLINPNVAIRPIENLSIGVGIQLSPSSVDIRRRFGFPTESGALADGGVKFGGTAFGVGGNLGIMYRPVEWLFLGYFYRSRIDLDFDGDAHFDVPAGMGDRNVFHDQKVKASVTLPDYMTLGVGFQVHPRVYLEVDVDYVMWSTVENLDIEFPDDLSGQLSEENFLDWSDIFTLRLSGRWDALVADAHSLRVSAGGGYDMTPVPDHTLSPLLPDSQRIFMSLGLGYTYEPWDFTVDVGYMLTLFPERTVDETDCDGDFCNPFPARYESVNNMVALDLSWRAF